MMLMSKSEEGGSVKTGREECSKAYSGRYLRVSEIVKKPLGLEHIPSQQIPF